MRPAAIFGVLFFALSIFPLYTSADDSLQDQLTQAVRSNDEAAFREALRKGAIPMGADSAGKRYFDYSKDKKWFIILAEEFPEGIDLWTGSMDSHSSEKESRQSQPAQPPKPITTFRLTEKTYAHDSLQTSKDLWVAASLVKVGDLNSSAFDLLLNQSMAIGSTLILPGGTRVALTGRATGIMSEITIPGRSGRWCIPNHALKQAGIPVPPVDHGYLQEQLP